MDKVGNQLAFNLLKNRGYETMPIWSLGLREEYTSRMAISGLGVVNGPYGDDNINSHEIPYQDRSKDWGASYLDQLRELALSYWLGSEYDIALIKIEQVTYATQPVTCIFHDFDALTHTALQLKYRFKWDDDKSCHIVLGSIDYSILIPYLLTYYNSVFIDDTIAGESWINYHSEIVKKIPKKIKVHRKGMEEQKYLQEETQKYTLEEN